MPMHLTDSERTLVEQNMHLVDRVLKRYVHNPNQCGIFSYEDLYQYGSIGLCKAAANYEADRQTTFETYAYTLIRNEIFNKLEYATRRKMREVHMDSEMPCAELPLETDPDEDLASLLDAASQKASGVIAKGIKALRMQAEGYSCKEIGQLFGGVSDNNVSAWMSRARKYLLQDPVIAAYAP